jgi:hypothetical protein
VIDFGAASESGFGSTGRLQEVEISTCNMTSEGVTTCTTATLLTLCPIFDRQVRVMRWVRPKKSLVLPVPRTGSIRDGSLLKGTLLLVWYWFRNKAFEKCRQYRVFANREPVIWTPATRQKCEDQFTRGRGPTAQRSGGSGGSVSESEMRLQLAAEHGIKTDSCRPAGYDDSLLASLSLLSRTAARRKPNGRMCFSY